MARPQCTGATLSQPGSRTMADKQVYELTLQDLLEHGVWYFPMDETVEDELTVRPAGPGQGFEQDYQVIVRTTFESREGSRYLGYLYWHASAHVCDSQPVVFVGNSDCIAFWSGIATPPGRIIPRQYSASARRCRWPMHRKGCLGWNLSAGFWKGCMALRASASAW